LSLDENLRPNGEPRHLHLKHFEKSGNSYPLWIGKNSEILFVSDRGGTERLWRVSARGGEPTLVASAGEGATLPTLSPFASKLVYTQGTFDTNIWAVDIAAGTARGAARPRKVISSTRLEHNSHVSPDASKLAFESSRSGYTEVWTSNLDGSHAAPLTNFRSSVTGSPQWAPDGKRVVFDSRVEGQPDLYVRGVEVEEVQRLTNHAAADVVPRWSRDGRWIYFASNRSGEFQVWKLPASGGEPVRVTKHGGFAAAESVDGKTLFYTKSRSDVTDLWRLTQHDGEEGPVLKSIIDRSFAVSHGGIYFLSAGPPVSLQFFSFATGRSTVLTTLNKAVQFGLALSPDGGTILFGQIDEQARDLMLIENFR
jgi:Tol biopolymer transport system component